MFLFLVCLSVPAAYLLAHVHELSTSKLKIVSVIAVMVLIILITICVALQPSTNQLDQSSFVFQVLYNGGNYCN